MQIRLDNSRSTFSTLFLTHTSILIFHQKNRQSRWPVLINRPINYLARNAFLCHVQLLELLVHDDGGFPSTSLKGFRMIILVSRCFEQNWGTPIKSRDYSCITTILARRKRSSYRSSEIFIVNNNRCQLCVSCRKHEELNVMSVTRSLTSLMLRQLDFLVN